MGGVGLWVVVGCAGPAIIDYSADVAVDRGASVPSSGTGGGGGGGPMRGPDDGGNVIVDVAGSGGSVSDGGHLVDSGVPDVVPSSLPSGPSAGCTAPATLPDAPGKWLMHTISVTGVAPGFLPGGANYGMQAGYDFTKRNYFLKLPAKYDPKRNYPLVFSGSGCGATNGISGNNGGSNALPDNQDFAIQVGLSYVYPQKAGACFADGFADTPDLPYFDAVLAEVKKTTCVDQGQVFMSGFSSGAWETYMLACARAGVIRGVGTQAGGLRSVRPPCSGVPVAAFLTAGTNDANPIHNVDSKTGFDSGSAPARDVILKTNGCTGTETAPYTNPNAPAGWNCRSYTSCPKAYPVIWCEIPGGHGAGSPSAFWPFWSMLPPP